MKLFSFHYNLQINNEIPIRGGENISHAAYGIISKVAKLQFWIFQSMNFLFFMTGFQE